MVTILGLVINQYIFEDLLVDFEPFCSEGGRQGKMHKQEQSMTCLLLPLLWVLQPLAKILIILGDNRVFTLRQLLLNVPFNPNAYIFAELLTTTRIPQTEFSTPRLDAHSELC